MSQIPLLIRQRLVVEGKEGDSMRKISPPSSRMSEDMSLREDEEQEEEVHELNVSV